ncbi:MAG: hypothetical protein WAU96_12925 [Anaerolineae bacterium]|nr:hypothetical protein [Thermoflexales bacterium]
MTTSSRLRQIIYILALIAILLTPISNYGEVSAFMTGKLRSEQFLETPLAVKLLKDAVMILVGLLALFMQARQFAKTRRLNPIAWAYVPLAVIVILAIALSYTTNENLQEPNNRLFILAGLRWVYPIFLTLVMIGVSDASLLRKTAILCYVMFVCSFALQIYQAFNASTWWGRTPLGLSARVAGFFLMPSTSGFFAATTVFLVFFYLKNRVLTIAMVVMALISVWLSASATGALLLLAILFLVSLDGKFIKHKLLLIPLLGVFTYFTIGIVTNRQDFTEVSGPVRINHVVESFRRGGAISNQFGLGSNGAVLLDNTFKLKIHPEVLDSSYAGTFINIGWLGAIAFYIPFIACFVISWRLRRLDGIVFVVMMLLASASQPITEEYPMNFLMSVWMGWFFADVMQPPGQLLAGQAAS